MFEQPAGKIEKDRSRSVMILSGGAVLAVIVLIILVTSFGKKPSKIEMAQRGAAEFDSYAEFMPISNIELKHGERLNTKYARILCTVRNTGDKVVDGLQLRAYVIGLNDELLREKIITPVPEIKNTLEPGQSMRIDVSLEPVPDASLIKDMKIELYGLKLE
jgi:hypothetical protein